MDEKIYPQRTFSRHELSTVVSCAGCGVHNRINEVMLIDDLNGLVYHVNCCPIGQTESKIYEMEITEDLGMKSE